MTLPVNTSPYPSVTSADIHEHTIQALVELVYCQTANEILTSAMGSLQQALATTQNALTTLTQLQNLKNSLKPLSKSAAFSAIFDYGGVSTDDYQEEYNDAASAYFGSPIDPAFYIGGTLITSTGSNGYAEFVDKLEAAKSALAVQITFLSSITATLPDGSPDPNTLLAKLHTVYDEIQTNNYSAVSNWVLDKYNIHGAQGVAESGNIQQHLTNAIAAGQALNSSQQQKVQNYLFVFQQYYQSASAVLNAIQQIISRMAQAIAR